MSQKLARGIALAALALNGCRHGDQHGVPQASASASAAASASLYALGARELHFQNELTRARAHWKSKPSLGDCTVVLHEKEDQALCEAASSALTVLGRDLEAAPERALPALENSALSLARLSKRLRYLSLGELSKKRLAGDAGAQTPPVAASGHGPLRWPSRPDERGHRTFELGDGPISQLMGSSVRLERDAVRNLGAYLEYAELPVRRTAFSTVKRLNEQHPEWPLLRQLLREATLLEAEPDLKSQLATLSASAQPPAAHSADSK